MTAAMEQTFRRGDLTDEIAMQTGSNAGCQSEPLHRSSANASDASALRLVRR